MEQREVLASWTGGQQGLGSSRTCVDTDIDHPAQHQPRLAFCDARITSQLSQFQEKSARATVGFSLTKPIVDWLESLLSLSC